jgi:hypothetical protein
VTLPLPSRRRSGRTRSAGAPRAAPTAPTAAPSRSWPTGSQLAAVGGDSPRADGVGQCGMLGSASAACWGRPVRLVQHTAARCVCAPSSRGTIATTTDSAPRTRGSVAPGVGARIPQLAQGRWDLGGAPRARLQLLPASAAPGTSRWRGGPARPAAGPAARHFPAGEPPLPDKEPAPSGTPGSATARFLVQRFDCTRQEAEKAAGKRN